jgi:coenzyme F420-reducing hydrogenase delta subunit
VLIAGCWPGDCHYLTGNLKAEERVKIIREILDVLGIEQERLRLEWVAASEGGRFAEVVRDFVSDLMNIGPSPLRR